jgi:aspartyl-tRNA(Asn)/glutamyl-tRNA(Gln) amidotransferase subunit B
MPKLSTVLKDEYMNVYGLSEYDARLLSDDKYTADYFNRLLGETKNYKAAANLMLGPVKNFLNEKGQELEQFALVPAQLAALIQLIDEGKTNFGVASTKILPAMVESPAKTPLQIAEELNLIQSSDSGLIEGLVDEVLAKYPEKVAEYKSGKTGLLGMFVGEVMKASKGKADPKLTNKIVMDKLSV